MARHPARSRPAVPQGRGPPPRARIPPFPPPPLPPPLPPPPRPAPGGPSGRGAAPARALASRHDRPPRSVRRSRRPPGRGDAAACRARRADRGAGPDDLRLAGRRCDACLRAAARPRPPRSRASPAAPGRGRARAAGCRHLRGVPELWPADRGRAPRGHPLGGPLHRLRPGGAVSDALVGLEDIRAAAERIRGVALRTPLVPFTAGPPPVILKAESLQPIGAFKIRGAWNAIAQLTDAERRRGVVTHSSGNHAQGVARAARLAGVRAVGGMPADAPAVKRARVEADGAEIVTVAVESGAREAMATRIVEERGLVLVPPYADDRIIAGQGTVGLEIAEDVPDLVLVLVPIGGGGGGPGGAAGGR